MLHVTDKKRGHHKNRILFVSVSTLCDKYIRWYERWFTVYALHSINLYKVVKKLSPCTISSTYRLKICQ